MRLSLRIISLAVTCLCFAATLNRSTQAGPWAGFPIRPQTSGLKIRPTVPFAGSHLALAAPPGKLPRPKKIVLIAGELDGTHPRGTHEYEKSVLLLKHCLETSPNLKGVRAETHFHGWPRDDSILNDADTIVVISNGSDRREADHPILVGDRLQVLEKQMKRGCGLVVIHWSTFFPNARAGEKALEWVGGHFDYQSGPPPRHWASAIKHVTTTARPGTPGHPICNGLEPFKVREEFYYHIRFRKDDPRLKPILRATIPGEKEEQTVAWAVERKDRGRGFGFTGGHYFDNWQIPSFRKMVLNAIVWTAHAEVPKAGVDSTPPKEKSTQRPGKPINALILTGHDGPFHDWRKTSKALREVLERDDRFKTRIVEDPEFLATGDLFSYGLLVQNYVNWERPGLSEKAKANLVRFLNNGRGLAVIHFANGAFHFSLPKAAGSDWPEYRRIVRRVWDHTKGKSGHDRFGPFHVKVTGVKHPITEGLPDFDTTDELYYRQAGEQPIEPLVVARSKDTGKDEPLAWAYTYGKGRVFQTLLGHAAGSIRAAGPAELIRRGSVWAAGREQRPVSGPAPVPPPPGSLTLVTGKFGKALDASSAPVEVNGNDRFRTPPLTVECWAKLNSKNGFNVLVAADPKTSANHWEIYSYAGSGAFSAYLPGKQPSEIVSKVDICDKQWHYLAMTHDGKTVTLFVDGKLVLAQRITRRPKLKPDPGPLTIGAAQEGKARIGCDGLIDEVRISSVIRKITGVPKAPLPLDLETVGQWRFDLEQAADVDPAWTPRPAEGAAEPWERATDKDWIDARFQQMDTGPYLNATFEYPGPGSRKVKSFKGTAIRVGDHGEAAVLFDRCQMRLAAGWTGDYLQHSSRRFGLLNTPKPAGKILFSTASGPGWADSGDLWVSKHPATAPLPSAWAKFRGLYLHGKRTVLSYTVGGVTVLESPWIEKAEGIAALTRSLEVGPSDRVMEVLVCQVPQGRQRSPDNSQGTRLLIDHNDTLTAVLLKIDRPDAMLRLTSGGQVLLRIPPHREALRFKLLIAHGNPKELNPGKVDALARASQPPPDLSAWTKPGPQRWAQTLITRGERGKDNGPFAIDTLTVPYQNPYKALFFLTGIDHLPDGQIAVCTAHGDVWLVKGADEKLEKLTWKRFATGLYQPLGLKVVDGKVFVLERGQLTRLHDTNGDGEADLYECFNNDWHTGSGEHSFDTCLETDPQGNFYFFKTGDTQTPTGGCLMCVSRDGSKAEIFCTGFRHPIGLGASPDGIITGADQEGNWMPSTRVDIYHKGGFYGDMRAHHRTKPPEIYDAPLCWLPRQMDNSAGGQVWVPPGKFGPLSGQMLHLSYGRCRILLLMRQKVGEIDQAGAVDLGLQFLSGVARGRFRPEDGYLYLVGLNGWQTAAVRDGCLQRVRYTGKKVLLPVALAAHTNGLLLTFSEPLDRRYAEDIKRYRVEQWNYHWSADYGSRRWSVARPGKAGQDTVQVRSARLLPDGKTVFLETQPLKPVMQMQIAYGLATTDGTPLAGTVCNTINKPAPDWKGR
jgi:type 1 glutamine amidotransferase